MNRRRALKIYIAAIGAVASAIVLVAAAEVVLLAPSQRNAAAPTAVLFIVFGLLAGRRQVLISESSTHVMSTTAQIATLLVLPYPVAILVVGAAKIISELSLWIQKRAKSWRAVVVNSGNTLISNAAAGAAFHLLHGDNYLWSHDVRSVLAFPAIFAMAGTYHLIDTWVVVGAITLSSEERPMRVFTHIMRGALLPELSLVFVGVVFAVLWHFSLVLSLLGIVPVIFCFRAFESVAKLRKETVEAVLKMAESIDYRDTGTYEHSKRIADLTRRLATHVGLTPEYVEDIVLASRVHDLGKIGISNEVLLKQGQLTRDERTTMQQHATIGANILSSYSAFAGSIEIVKHHHERWDGTGYPDGLRGEEIPLGSRIIAVVDAYDAMTDDRVYRAGMSVAEAVSRLKDGIGAQFDPKVCATFIQMLIEEGVYEPVPASPELRLIQGASG